MLLFCPITEGLILFYSLPLSLSSHSADDNNDNDDNNNNKQYNFEDKNEEKELFCIDKLTEIKMTAIVLCVCQQGSGHCFERGTLLWRKGEGGTMGILGVNTRMP